MAAPRRTPSGAARSASSRALSVPGSVAEEEAVAASCGASARGGSWTTGWPVAASRTTSPPCAGAVAGLEPPEACDAALRCRARASANALCCSSVKGEPPEPADAEDDASPEAGTSGNAAQGSSAGTSGNAAHGSSDGGFCWPICCACWYFVHGPTPGPLCCCCCCCALWYFVHGPAPDTASVGAGAAPGGVPGAAATGPRTTAPASLCKSSGDTSPASWRTVPSRKVISAIGCLQTGHSVSSQGEAACCSTPTHSTARSRTNVSRRPRRRRPPRPLLARRPEALPSEPVSRRGSCCAAPCRGRRSCLPDNRRLVGSWWRTSLALAREPPCPGTPPERRRKPPPRLPSGCGSTGRASARGCRSASSENSLIVGFIVSGSGRARVMSREQRLQLGDARDDLLILGVCIARGSPGLIQTRPGGRVPMPLQPGGLAPDRRADRTLTVPLRMLGLLFRRHRREARSSLASRPLERAQLVPELLFRAGRSLVRPHRLVPSCAPGRAATVEPAAPIGKRQLLARLPVALPLRAALGQERALRVVADQRRVRDRAELGGTVKGAAARSRLSGRLPTPAHRRTSLRTGWRGMSNSWPSVGVIPPRCREAEPYACPASHPAALLTGTSAPSWGVPPTSREGASTPPRGMGRMARRELKGR
ncbi:hypothetical protein D516_2690 [Rhodobacter sp. AKP1]|nr:hypothetical protein D516_2690 [Rhodobacter sp. AKP1]